MSIGDFGVPELEALVAPRVRGPADGDGNAALAVCTSILLGLDAPEAGRRWSARVDDDDRRERVCVLGRLQRLRGQGAAGPARPRPLRVGRSLPSLSEAREGWIFLAAPLQSEWEALAPALGLVELLADRAL